jgi:hypothetical protein
MRGPGVPSRRGAAVLRRDGQHTGKVNRATRLDVTGASQDGDQGEGKDKAAAVVLTMGGDVVVAGSVKRCVQAR